MLNLRKLKPMVRAVVLLLLPEKFLPGLLVVGDRGHRLVKEVCVQQVKSKVLMKLFQLLSIEGWDRQHVQFSADTCSRYRYLLELRCPVLCFFEELVHGVSFHRMGSIIWYVILAKFSKN